MACGWRLVRPQAICFDDFDKTETFTTWTTAKKQTRKTIDVYNGNGIYACNAILPCSTVNASGFRLFQSLLTEKFPSRFNGFQTRWIFTYNNNIKVSIHFTNCLEYDDDTAKKTTQIIIIITRINLIHIMGSVSFFFSLNKQEHRQASWPTLIFDIL